MPCRESLFGRFSARSQARGRRALAGCRLHPGLRRSRAGCHGRRIPTARRYCHIDGVIRLLLRRKGLDRELCRRERLWIEPLGDIVALARGIGIALRRRQAEPLEGFGKVLFDADAAGIEDAEVELAVADPAVGRLAEPLRRALVVRTLAAAIGV